MYTAIIKENIIITNYYPFIIIILCGRFASHPSLIAVLSNFALYGSTNDMGQ
jgi:hypothetical protein